MKRKVIIVLVLFLFYTININAYTIDSKNNPGSNYNGSSSGSSTSSSTYWPNNPIKVTTNTFSDSNYSGFGYFKYDVSGMEYVESEIDPEPDLEPEPDVTISIYESMEQADGLRILPNYISYRENNVANMFYLARSMSRDGNAFGIDYSIMNSHMMKNSEWGAVAYLSQSKYGKYGNSDYTGANKEVYQNKSSSFITGNSNGTSSTTTNTQCAYDDITDRGSGTGSCGGGASTTGNITGVYDMSGGSFEYVMGVFANSDGTKWSGNSDTNNSGFEGKVGSSALDYAGLPWPIEKYYDVYRATSGTTISSTTACNGGICYGHALSETASWYGDYADFVSPTDPWFIRGGNYDNDTTAGVFHLVDYFGCVNSNISFRVVLTPQ